MHFSFSQYRLQSHYIGPTECWPVMLFSVHTHSIRLLLARPRPWRSRGLRIVASLKESVCWGPVSTQGLCIIYWMSRAWWVSKSWIVLQQATSVLIVRTLRYYVKILQFGSGQSNIIGTNLATQPVDFKVILQIHR